MDESPHDDDKVIGLDVRGQIFYCPLSRLLAANEGCSYFSARFNPDGMLDPGLLRIDGEGREIYGLDRDPFVFQHVVEYLRTGERPTRIGRYEINKSLWHDLRTEADYFGLPELGQLLMYTFSCSPEADGAKGVLHWLGTKKGTMGYCNPYERGAVDVITNWFDDDDDDETKDWGEEEKNLFVQYRPDKESAGLFEDHEPRTCKIVDGKVVMDELIPASELMNSDSEEVKKQLRHAISGAMGLFGMCDGEGHGTVKFKNGLSVSPTHFSLRSGGCFGMSGDWNFEASVDGKRWAILHRSRGKTPLYHGFSDDVVKIRDHARGFDGTEARKQAICDYMEKHHRHTWKLKNPRREFFSFFRIKSAWGGHRAGRTDFCLHACGLEIYGDVREEWEEHPSDVIIARIDELESQVETLHEQKKKLDELELQVEKLQDQKKELESRVTQLESDAKSSLKRKYPSSDDKNSGI